ncbi:Hypp5531 [Branchiostoma lanceolatum]|uniref:Hypp5531 protein n=1 Tax=Branchiostoma lanceolatum TaxID=7740 RepID=A0A8J9W2F4_BRALA|nr:Hypp5531 [Branchiostoma lanceolatum]
MPGSRMRPITFSERGHVSSTENGVWMSYPPSKEAITEFTLRYNEWTPSGETVFSTINLDQTFGAFPLELDLQAVQVNPQGNWTWFMSNRGFLQEREQFQVTPAARDSAVFTMSNQMSLLSSMMSLPEDIFGQSPTHGEIIKLSYTDVDGHNIVQQPIDITAVKVTLFTKEGRVLLPDLVMGEVTFEDVAKMHCLKICERLGHTEFTFRATSSFLPTGLMVGGFGIDVNVIAVRAGDADRWFWKVCNTGYLEKRTVRETFIKQAKKVVISMI